jgi:hypothetical protein
MNEKGTQIFMINADFFSYLCSSVFICVLFA